VQKLQLGSFADDDLPFEATSSMEADVAFFDDPADAKADQVDGAIGELSTFHETFGYYAQGVSVTLTSSCSRQRSLAVTQHQRQGPAESTMREPGKSSRSC
jgi:hypothetical protein